MPEPVSITEERNIRQVQPLFFDESARIVDSFSSPHSLISYFPEPANVEDFVESTIFRDNVPRSMIVDGAVPDIGS